MLPSRRLGPEVGTRGQGVGRAGPPEASLLGIVSPRPHTVVPVPVWVLTSREAAEGTRARPRGHFTSVTSLEAFLQMWSHPEALRAGLQCVTLGGHLPWLGPASGPRVLWSS